MAAVSILHIIAYPHEPYRLRAQAIDDSNNDECEAPGHDQYPLTQVLETQSRDGWTPQHRVAADDRVRDGTRKGHQPAKPHEPAGHFNWKALVDALNFIDVIFAVVTASRWLVAQRREDAARTSAVDSDFDSPYTGSDTTLVKTDDLSQALDRAQAPTSSMSL